MWFGHQVLGKVETLFEMLQVNPTRLVELNPGWHSLEEDSKTEASGLEGSSLTCAPLEG